MMRKMLSWICLVVLSIVFLAGCGNNNPTCPQQDQDQMMIVTINAPYHPNDTVYIRFVNNTPYGVDLVGDCIFHLERRDGTEWRDETTCDSHHLQIVAVVQYDSYQEEMAYDPARLPSGEYRVRADVTRRVGPAQSVHQTVYSATFQLLPG